MPGFPQIRHESVVVFDLEFTAWEGSMAHRWRPLASVAFEGQKHNALDDARSVAAGIRALVARGAASPFLA